MFSNETVEHREHDKFGEGIRHGRSIRRRHVEVSRQKPMVRWPGSSVIANQLDQYTLAFI